MVRIYYDTGKRLFYQDASEVAVLPVIGDSVHLPDGNYDIVKRRFSPAFFKGTGAARTRRDGWDRLVEIMQDLYSGPDSLDLAKRIQTATNIGNANVSAGGIELPDHQGFDDVIYMQLHPVSARTLNFDLSSIALIDSLRAGPTTGIPRKGARDKHRKTRA